MVEYWRETYDWRQQETLLNTFPQFTTEIDGQTVHFLHIRSPEPDALPLIVTHGCPGSIVEFTQLIGPLTDPRAHGGDPADAFHIVAPSIPGFGFSVPIRETGGTCRRISGAFAVLMQRLGYDRYGAHGGDIGAGITDMLANTQSDHVVGAHAVTDPSSFIILGAEIPVDTSRLTEAERDHVAQLQARLSRGRTGYLQIQSTRPQTLAYSLTDSPIGQLAWIVEKSMDEPDRCLARRRRRSRPASHQHQRLLVHRHRRHCRELHLRVLSLRSGVDRAVQHAARHGCVQPRSHFAPCSIPTRPLLTGRNSSRVATSQPWRRRDLLVGDIRAFFRGLR